MEDNHGSKDISILRKGALITEILPLVIGLLPSLSNVTFVRYCPSTGAKTRRTLADSLAHDSEPERRSRFQVPAAEVNFRWLQEQAHQLRSDQLLGICSLCKLNDRTAAHIPMLDLRCEPSASNLKSLHEAFCEIGYSRGILLASGQSYHFYGLELLTDESWREFMALSLLLPSFVDTRYIGHRLLAGTSVLRVTTNRLKPHVPQVTLAFGFDE